eukprot:TRINITY_DN8200_c0_g1_i1.p1 TRINITY_DN8200_c0_g1~~TRINITY_DN8200_c0_g1_i1.p1  ORF type:complete len:777 (+),score=133.90 TRINITY_DN8200_c0_g1_i1:38-2332(+)
MPKNGRRDLLASLSDLNLPRASGYKELKMLGEGGFATTHLVEINNEIVVWKKCKLDTDVQVTVARKELEAMAILKAKGVSSPYLVEYYGAEWCGNRLCIRLQYVEGPPLAYYEKGPRSLTVTHTMKFFTQLCDGVAALHAISLYHRDISTSNLMLTSTNPDNANLVIIDFGLAKRLDEGEKAVTDCGTPDFKYPLLGRVEGYFGWDADMWCVGRVVHRLLFNSDCINGLEDIEGLVCAVGTAAEGLNPSLRSTLPWKVVKLQSSDLYAICKYHTRMAGSPSRQTAPPPSTRVRKYFLPPTDSNNTPTAMHVDRHYLATAGYYGVKLLDTTSFKLQAAHTPRPVKALSIIHDKHQMEVAILFSDLTAVWCMRQPRSPAAAAVVSKVLDLPNVTSIEVTRRSRAVLFRLGGRKSSLFHLEYYAGRLTLVLVADKLPLCCVAFEDHKGSVCAVSVKDGVVSWHAVRRGSEPTRTPYKTHDGAVFTLSAGVCLHCSSTGSHLAVLSREDRSVTVYAIKPNEANEMTVQAKVRVPVKNTDHITSMSFSDVSFMMVNQGTRTVSCYDLEACSVNDKKLTHGEAWAGTFSSVGQVVVVSHYGRGVFDIEKGEEGGIRHDVTKYVPKPGDLAKAAGFIHAEKFDAATMVPGVMDAGHGPVHGICLVTIRELCFIPDDPTHHKLSLPHNETMCKPSPKQPAVITITHHGLTAYYTPDHPAQLNEILQHGQPTTGEPDYQIATALSAALLDPALGYLSGLYSFLDVEPATFPTR